MLWMIYSFIYRFSWNKICLVEF